MSKCEICSSSFNIMTFHGGAQRAHYCEKCVNAAFQEISPASFPMDGVMYSKDLLGDMCKFDRIFREKIEENLAAKAKQYSNVLSFKKPQTTLRKKSAHCPVVDEALDSLTPKNPIQVYDELSKAVIGQENAKRVVSVAYMRHQMAAKNKKIKKMNIIFVGPTGCGKTEIARQLAKIQDVPLLKVDASQLTPSGYKGDNPDTILSNLINICGGSVEVAQNAIVLLDEFDKLAAFGDSEKKLKKGVQEELLKIVEGGIFTVDMGHGQSKATINTENIMFIAAGAFRGIETLMKPQKVRKVGLSQIEEAKEDESSDTVQVGHLLKYGLISELVGRFSNIATLNELNEGELISILKDKEDNLCEEYKEIFAEMGLSLEYTESFYKHIVSEVKGHPSGIRAMRMIFEEYFNEVLFSGKFTGDKHTIIKSFDSEIEAPAQMAS